MGELSILCFGDSITQGYVDLEGGWTQRLRRRLDRDATVPMGATTFPAHAVFNLGISGDTAEEPLVRLEPDLGPRRIGERLAPWLRPPACGRLRDPLAKGLRQ